MLQYIQVSIEATAPHKHSRNGSQLAPSPRYAHSCCGVQQLPRRLTATKIIICCCCLTCPACASVGTPTLGRLAESPSRGPGYTSPLRASQQSIGVYKAAGERSQLAPQAVTDRQDSSAGAAADACVASPPLQTQTTCPYLFRCCYHNRPYSKAGACGRALLSLLQRPGAGKAGESVGLQIAARHTMMQPWHSSCIKQQAAMSNIIATQTVSAQTPACQHKQ